MTPVDATTGRRLDREAIIAIAGMYADRLRLDPFNDGACDPDMQSVARQSAQRLPRTSMWCGRSSCFMMRCSAASTSLSRLSRTR